MFYQNEDPAKGKTLAKKKKGGWFVQTIVEYLVIKNASKRSTGAKSNIKRHAAKEERIEMKKRQILFFYFIFLSIPTIKFSFQLIFTFQTSQLSC
jgi:hypothetical protein